MRTFHRFILIFILSGLQCNLIAYADGSYYSDVPSYDQYWFDGNGNGDPTDDGDGDCLPTAGTMLVAWHDSHGWPQMVWYGSNNYTNNPAGVRNTYDCVLQGLGGFGIWDQWWDHMFHKYGDGLAAGAKLLDEGADWWTDDDEFTSWSDIKNQIDNHGPLFLGIFSDELYSEGTLTNADFDVGYSVGKHSVCVVGYLEEDTNTRWMIANMGGDGYGLSPGWINFDAADNLYTVEVRAEGNPTGAEDDIYSSPSEGIIMANRRPQFTWESMENADWYHLWISRDGEKYHSAWVQKQSDWQPEERFKGGDYKWWIGTWKNGSYQDWSGPHEFGISRMVPEKVDLIKPAGVVDTMRPAFDWSADEHAEWYRLWVQKDGSKFLSEWLEGETGFTPADDIPMGEYKWWVQAWSPDGSTWSDSASFTYGLSTPLNPTGSVETSQPEFKWSQVADAEWYQIVVQRNGSSYDKKWIQNDETWTFADDLPYGTYKWWVRTWNSLGMGPWSGPMEFSTPSAEREQPALIAPVGEAQAPVTLRYEAARADWYRVFLQRDGVKELDKWTQETTLDVGTLPSGNYSWWVAAWNRVTGATVWSDRGDFTMTEAPEAMVHVEGGSFTMGDTWGDGDSDELPTHSVTVSSFHMSKYEVTNDEMADIMNWAEDRGKLDVDSSSVHNANGDSQELLNLNGDCQISWNGSAFVVDAGKGDYPCVEVSWYGAAAYCNYRSEKESATPCYDLSDWTCDWGANGYRLPTEAEWEYAAKGGRNGSYTKYSGSDNLDSVAWYYGNSDASGNSGFFYGKGTLPVGTKADNELGIHDMSGNVDEWCHDISHWDYNGAPTDGSAWMSGGDNSFRVLRSGDWYDSAGSCRVANRYGAPPGNASDGSGFRCVR